MKKYKQFVTGLPSNTVVFAFGRFNPPTTGHELLVKVVKKLAASNKASHAIYASKTQDAKKNPLTVQKKVHYLKLMFPGTNFVAASPTVPTFIQAAKELNKKYKNIIMVAGSDRIQEYQRILNTYNGKEFNFDSVQVVSAGERDPDSDDATGMSASKMRSLASKGDFANFKRGLPSSMREIDGRRLMNDVRQGMGLDLVKEQLNLVKDDLREQYFRGEIFNIGDIVESADVKYEIVKRGSNHLLLKHEDGSLVSKWIQDVSVITEEKEESMISEELTSKTLKSADKIKVARIIATMLGVDGAEKSTNTDALVNMALRKVRTKPLNAESLRILSQMLKLATSVGIKYDDSLVPTKIKESKDDVKVDQSTTYNAAKDKLSLSDFIKLQAAQNGKPGSSMATNDYSRKMKVKYQLEEVEELDEISSELAGRYIQKATQDQVNKKGIRGALKDKTSKRAKGIDTAYDRVLKKEEVELDESQTEHWKKIQSMDKGSILGGKEGARKKLAYLNAVHDYHKKYGNDTKKVKGEIERINRSRLAEEELDEAVPKATGDLKDACWKGYTAVGMKMKGGKKVPNCVPVKEETDEEEADSLVKSKIGSCPKCGKAPCKCDPGKEMGAIGQPSVNRKPFDPFFREETEDDKTVDMLEYEKEYHDNIDGGISDEELDALAAQINDIDDILDAYDDHELSIIDDETGEEVPDEDEEAELKEGVLCEVLSRIERMKSRIRIKRTKAKRERKMKIALKRYSDSKTINKRSRRLAVKLMKKRLLRGRNMAKLSVGEKERVERMIEKRKSLIGRLALRLAPRVRKIEKSRMSNTKFTQGATPNVGF